VRFTALRVASRNFVTECLIGDVTVINGWMTIGSCGVVGRQIAVLGDEPLNSLPSPSPDTLLERPKLSLAVSSRVTSLELDEKFKRGLIRLFL
jgi:hypothetical protein